MFYFIISRDERLKAGTPRTWISLRGWYLILKLSANKLLFRLYFTSLAEPVERMMIERTYFQSINNINNAANVCLMTSG